MEEKSEVRNRDGQYEITRWMVYKVTRKRDDKLLFVGIGTCNADNIYVELRDYHMRSIVFEPKEIQDLPIKEKEYQLVQLMADSKNNSKEADRIRDLVTMQMKPPPLHKFTTDNMRATGLLVAI